MDLLDAVKAELEDYRDDERYVVKVWGEQPGLQHVIKHTKDHIRRLDLLIEAVDKRIKWKEEHAKRLKERALKAEQINDGGV